MPGVSGTEFGCWFVTMSSIGSGKRSMHMLHRVGVKTGRSMVTRLKHRNVLLFFSCLDLQSVINVSRTSTLLHAHYLTYRHIAWDPLRRYRNWFPNANTFRRLIRDTNTVISGSFVVQFFDREFYPGSDMDIYLRMAGVDDLCKWLKTQGYRYILRNREYAVMRHRHRVHVQRAVQNKSSHDNPLLAVYNFQRWVASASGYIERQRIQVIVVDTDPVEHILFDFHSTVVMNFMTSREAVSVFPAASFLSRLSFISKVRPLLLTGKPQWREKYERRGYVFVDHINAVLASSELLGRTSRYRLVTDKYCWHMTFPVTVADVFQRDSCPVRRGPVMEPMYWTFPSRSLHLVLLSLNHVPQSGWRNPSYGGELPLLNH
ncbi:hypothetical protein CVT26_004162 [Gymnopilus dilepis]|uniref:Uncharacterized protein n=1 Tax=Gymnopilus dilepis TaxID=231916 RepID=A0A409WN55_9AGAR|nr:hypothetical protein CVT26_004162 [Gymnopilus dilepis]